jgi:hypothetical protein
MDRAFRNALNYATMLKRWLEQGVYVRILNFGMDTSNPTGLMVAKMVGGMLAYFAEFESHMIGQRKRDANKVNSWANSDGQCCPAANSLACGNWSITPFPLSIKIVGSALSQEQTQNDTAAPSHSRFVVAIIRPFVVRPQAPQPKLMCFATKPLFCVSAHEHLKFYGHRD